MSKVITADKKTINAWTFYDWANSAYPLVITTAIFPIFYEKVTSIIVDEKVVDDTVIFLGKQFINTELYSYVVALSFIIVSLLSPLLSGIADYSGNKKRFMQFFCYLGSLSCASLFFFSKDNLLLGMTSILLASVGFWGSLVFYNAFLPEIAAPEDHDKVSAQGFSRGYLGSSLLLIANLIIMEVFGNHLAKYSFLSVAIWWVGFAQITFARLPNGSKKEGIEKKNIILKGFKELIGVWNELKHIVPLKRYLIAFFIYSMGIQTVMLMAVMFAKKEIIGLEDSNLIISVLLIQFLAMGGSHLFSFLSSKIGNIKSLGINIFIWVVVCIITYKYVYTPEQFYVIAASIGLIMGGVQSLSRSTYSKLLPETSDTASYFSFYDVCEKVGIVIGMFSFGYIEGITGGMRNSVLALITFFVVGFVLLLFVPKTKEN